MISNSKFANNNFTLEIFEKLKMLADTENKTQNFSLTKFEHLQGDFQKKDFFINYHYNTTIFKWFKYFYIKTPINLLFSLDQFFFEFLKKQSRKKRPSEFQQQLKEQKKLALFYGILSKKELKKIIENTKNYQGYFYKNFFSLLEKRLDVVLYRNGFAKTITLARQQIKHKKILVNNKVVTIPSYILEPGDCISVELRYADSISTALLLSLKTSFKLRRHFDKNSIFRPIKRKFTTLKLSEKSYRILKSLIQLLIKKIAKRADIKIKPNNLLLIKYKPLITNQAKSLIYSLKKNKYILSEKKPLFIHSKNCFFSKRNKKKKSFNKQEFSNKKFQINRFQTKTNFVYENLINKLFNLLNNNTTFQHFLIPEFKKHSLKKRFFFYNVKSLKYGGLKPLHLETSYSLLKTIYLYAPQRLKFPFSINIDLIARAYK